MTQCDRVGVALPDPETGALRLYAKDFQGLDEISEVIKRQPHDPSSWEPELADDVFRTGQFLNFTTEQFASDPRIRGAAKLSSFCLLPLISHERVQGVLGVRSSQENAYNEDDVFSLRQVANQIALAVENALAYRQISQVKERLSRENVLDSEIRGDLYFEEIVGNSEALRCVLRERLFQSGQRAILVQRGAIWFALLSRKFAHLCYRAGRTGS